MPPTEAVWPQFAMQVFGGVQSVPPFGVMGGCRGSELILHSSGWATLGLFLQTVFFGKTYRLTTVHTLQTTDRQTDGRTTHRAISATVSTVG